MITSRVMWIAAIVLSLIITLLSANLISAVLAALIFLLPLASAILNFAISPALEFYSDVSGTCQKGQKVTINLFLRNKTFLPYRLAYFSVHFKNMLTGEECFQNLKGSLFSKGELGFTVELNSQLCGTIDIFIKNVRLYDFWGITYRTIENNDVYEIAMIPDISDIDYNFKLYSQETDDIEFATGDDMSEIYAFRDYAAGDSPGQIAWKISQKYNKLIVRQGSRLSGNSVCIVFINPGGQPAELLSKSAETAVSISVSLCETGISHSIILADYQYFVETENDIRAGLGKMLRAQYPENLSDFINECKMFATPLCVTADEITAQEFSKNGIAVILA